MVPPAVDDAIDPAGIRRALVIKLRHHGDVLLSSPVFTVLKRAAPHAEIDALVYLETAPMLERHPAISIVHTIDRSLKSRGPLAQLAGDGRLWRALRARRYDLVVHLTEHPRGAWMSWIAAARWSVAPERERAGWFWRSCFSHRFPLPQSTPRHVVEANLDALRRIGIWPQDDDKRLVHVPGPEAEARVTALLAQHGVDRGRFVVVHPGSRWLFKCLPAGPTAAVVDHLGARGLAVVLTGGFRSGRGAARHGGQGRSLCTARRSDRTAVDAGAVRADRRGATLRWLRYRADASCVRGRHAGRRLVRAERRTELGPVARAASSGRRRPSILAAPATTTAAAAATTPTAC